MGCVSSVNTEALKERIEKLESNLHGLVNTTMLGFKNSNEEFNRLNQEIDNLKKCLKKGK
jgi:predicted  nucleic acid-binding Zn-ribbon protein